MSFQNCVCIGLFVFGVGRGDGGGGIINQRWVKSGVHVLGEKPPDVPLEELGFLTCEGSRTRTHSS